MSITFRPEREEEFPVIYDLIKTAFETAPVADGTEQDFANRLRAGNGYVSELALVAEDESGAIIGHIMLTGMPVETPKGPYEVLLLAPICVALERRGEGIGTRLIEEVFSCAREKGYGAVILLGDPAYYSRFGFKASVDFGIKNTNGFPEINVMMCELVPGALEKVSGTIHFDV